MDGDGVFGPEGDHLRVATWAGALAMLIPICRVWLMGDPEAFADLTERGVDSRGVTMNGYERVVVSSQDAVDDPIGNVQGVPLPAAGDDDSAQGDGRFIAHGVCRSFVVSRLHRSMIALTLSSLLSTQDGTSPSPMSAATGPA